MEQLFNNDPSSIQKPYISYPKLRIADVLTSEEEEGDLDGDASDMNCLRWSKHEFLEPQVECPSPRKTISRWMKRMVEKKVAGRWGEKVERERVVVDLDRQTGETCAPSHLDESGNHRKESMLNLGVACSLLHIIAASKNELNKMKDLHTEMDMTLQKMIAVVQRKDSLYEPSKSKDGASSCLTYIREVSRCSSQYSRQSHLKSCPFSEQETLTACESVKHDKSKQESIEGIEELEAELEAELERLQLQLDGGGFSKYSQHHNAETMVEATALSSSCASVWEVIDPREVPAEVQCGVSPAVLERRLHELLESRQQERIKELEAALECAEKKLHEKEIEVSWWKDTALIISQHAVEPSRCAMLHNRDSF